MRSSTFGAIGAAGPLQRDCPLLSSPELEQVGRLLRIANAPAIELSTPALSLALRR